MAVIDPVHARITEGVNLAGEPRNDVAFAGGPARAQTVRDGSVDIRGALARGALARSVALAGAVEQAEAMADQAVALADAQDADAGQCTGGAPDARNGGDVARAAAAAAKVCAGRAAGIAMVTGHQLHGAIGFTQEHALHRFTRRLMAWRDEYGAEALWCAELGDLVAAGGADGLWKLLTSGGVHE